MIFWKHFNETFCLLNNLPFYLSLVHAPLSATYAKKKQVQNNEASSYKYF